VPGQPIAWIGHPVISPWLRRLARLLTLTAALLLIVGAVRPWAFVPLGGLRLPLYGSLGWGALAGVAGLFLLFHPRPSPPVLLCIAVGAAYLARVIPQRLLSGARAATGAVDSWFEPLNQLLERFRIEGLHLADWGLPAARAIGPGASLTVWGAGFAAAAALLALLAPERPPLPRACPSCSHPLSRRPDLRFCPACGSSLSLLPVCPSCHAPAEVSDCFCGQCGVRLPV
jgi:hypothetical protein